MKTMSKVGVACLLVGTAMLVHAQKVPQKPSQGAVQPAPQEKSVKPVAPMPVPPDAGACPKALVSKPVNLCDLAAQMHIDDHRKPPLTIWKTPDHQRQFALPNHADVTLSISACEQIVWSCTRPAGPVPVNPANPQSRVAPPVGSAQEALSFVITGIAKVEEPRGGSVAGAPEFPFCVNFLNTVNKPPSPTQSALLPSGVPRRHAVGQMYKYSFTIGSGTWDSVLKHFQFNNLETDPHLIVTDSGTVNRPGHGGDREPRGCDTDGDGNHNGNYGGKKSQ